MDGSRAGEREGDDGPRLLRPVGPGSRIVSRPGVRYSEVAGVPVLWEPSAMVLHELTPAGAALWARLDGRTLDEVLSTDGVAHEGLDEGLAAGVPAVDGARAERRRETIEAVRRLRALRLVEDRRPDEPVTAVGAGVAAEVAALPARVAVRARVEVADAGASLVLGGDESGRAVVEIDVADRRVVALTPPGGRRVDAAVDLVGIVAATGSETARGARAGPVGTTEALMRAATEAAGDEGELPVLVLDVMAALAEDLGPGRADQRGVIPSRDRTEVTLRRATRARRSDGRA